jgi:hypothetical protein
MHGPISVKSRNNTSKWQMGFNSAFKGLITLTSGSHGLRLSSLAGTGGVPLNVVVWAEGLAL